MAWESLIPTVMLLSISGALAPGPLFFATITYGIKGGAKSGFMVALGHTVFEFPLIIAMALGILSVINVAQAKPFIGIIGSAAIIVFGALQLRSALNHGATLTENTNLKIPTNAFLVGLLFTGLNPFFIIWWLTIGMKLVLDSLLLASLVGVGIMYVSHVWIDYAWLMFISHIANKASNFIKERWMKVLMVSLSLILIIFGVFMLVNVLLG
ncbi:MAG: LysE family translocator [Thaumarchaeota archaeon]|jgi:threonine/homoserine/homoserine lactone efflux protein|nr:LysE family translocator [Candidatus Terraquivivens yellowstonensis]MCL7387675.1 LysE family translocator [Candidatus Terraquivivens yellowstonensis]MCL7392586.1 LysE family translocator [Candidatus Terraquivivens yellowstonensis]MCL7395244.1 LysE family translocator [Candidatus Terraquivivens yellowstonensis]MCL7398467.1 LysE family translocator [Candidatus Terraquivivens yellowstonensis]